MDDREKQLILSRLTAEEKALTETANTLARIRTAIAQGATADTLGLGDCALVSVVLGKHAVEMHNDQTNNPEADHLLEISETGFIAVKWAAARKLKMDRGDGA